VSIDDYRLKILEVFDMIECKPVSTPITKELLKEMTADIEAGNFMDKIQTRNYQRAMGMFNWDIQTSGTCKSMAVSLMGKYNATPAIACDKLVKHMVRYTAGTIGQRLKNKPNSKNTLVVASDSDLAGMHSVTGDLRSRGVSAIFYKDMIIDYWSGWVGVHNSSGAAETYALSKALQRAMHVKYIGEEMGIPMPRIIEVYVDATVAISFAADAGNPTGMKFIDLRWGWVCELRDKKRCKVIKVPTESNPADFGTKLSEVGTFRRQRSYYLHTPRDNKELRQHLKEQHVQCCNRVDLSILQKVNGYMHKI
jgi:hypothetical protein